MLTLKKPQTEFKHVWIFFWNAKQVQNTPTVANKVVKNSFECWVAKGTQSNLIISCFLYNWSQVTHRPAGDWLDSRWCPSLGWCGPADYGATLLCVCYRPSLNPQRRTTQTCNHETTLHFSDTDNTFALYIHRPPMGPRKKDSSLVYSYKYTACKLWKTHLHLVVLP